MYEQILKYKPKGATHWQAGNYYKIGSGIKQVWADNTWCNIAIIGNSKEALISEAMSMLCMTPLPQD